MSDYHHATSTFQGMGKPAHNTQVIFQLMGGWEKNCIKRIHRAKSEISYVFYVDDRCRIGLIHMSATNPIEEI